MRPSVVRAAGALLIGAALSLVAHGLSLTPPAVAQMLQPTCAAQSDPATPITVATGETFAIGVPSNRTTGYAWGLDTPPDPAVVQLVTSVYVLPAPSSGPPLAGEGGRECWIFSGVGSGQTTLTLNYLRPFDPPGTPPGQSLTFTVVVQ